jgi:segregation and condensation protein B
MPETKEAHPDAAASVDQTRVVARKAAPATVAAGPAVEPERLAQTIEALILTSDRPVQAGRLAQALALGVGDGTRQVKAAIDELNVQYEASGRAFRIEHVAGGYRAIALPEFAPSLAALHGLRESQGLSRAAIETLAIIAYRQPIARAALESIRGVACGEVLRSLLEKRLIDITGRAEELGRPMLYGTTRRFLEVFGLASIKDLPSVTDFAPAPAYTPSKPKSSETSGTAEDTSES